MADASQLGGEEDPLVGNLIGQVGGRIRGREVQEACDDRYWSMQEI